MAKIYKQPFEHSGDTIAIPDAIQPDGEKVVEVYNVNGGNGHTHTFIVQAGLTYKIDMTRGSIVKWMELSE